KGVLEVQRGTLGTAYDLLLSAAHAVAHEDPAWALELQAQAIWVGFIGGWPERTIADASNFVKEVPYADAAYEEYFRTGGAAMAAADSRAREAALAMPPENGPAGATAKDFRFLINGMLVRAYLGDIPNTRELNMRVLATARSAGSFSRLP